MQNQIDDQSDRTDFTDKLVTNSKMIVRLCVLLALILTIFTLSLGYMIATHHPDISHYVSNSDDAIDDDIPRAVGLFQERN
jgi:hypothetical protein